MSFHDVEKGGRVPVFSALEVVDGTLLPEAVDYVHVPSGDMEKPVSPSLSKYAPALPRSTDALLPMKRFRFMLVYDANWQHRDITERHLFYRQINCCPKCRGSYLWLPLGDLD